MGIRIVLADDVDLTLIGARMVLEQDHRFRVLVAVRNLDRLLTITAAQQPDIVLLNEWFDRTDVLAVVEHLNRSSPNTRLIVMGTLADGYLIRDLFACGVRGYLYKYDTLEECLIPAVEIVMNNRPYLSPTANAEYLVAMRSPQRDWKLDVQSRTVLRLLAQGLHAGEIAARMGLTVGRVYEIRRKLRRRFHVTTNEHLVLRAAEEGFHFPDD